MSQTKINVGMIDGSGTPGSGNFLRGDGSWQVVGGSDVEFVSTVSASGASSVAFESLASGYNYHVTAEGLSLIHI